MLSLSLTYEDIMLVELKQAWFAPTAAVMKDKIQSISGRRYKKGVHEMPDSLFPALPSDAVVLEGMPEVEETETVSLKDFDMERASVEKEVEVNNTVHDNLKKAREAKAAKAAKNKSKG